MMFWRRVSFFLTLCSSSFVAGYSKFEPNCTRPDKPYNYVDDAPTRGTLTILWTSIFTVFACTWTIQHLTVPEQRGDRDPGIRGDWKWGWRRFSRKVKWMFLTVLAPEIVLVIAVARLDHSQKDYTELKELANKQGVPWTLTHTLFANMGGFVLRSRLGPNRQKDKGLTVSQGENETSQDTTENPIEGPYPSLKSPSPENSEIEVHSIQQITAHTQHIATSDSSSKAHHLVANEIIMLAKADLIKLPCITEAEIEDRSKGDAFAKLLAIFQITWTCIDVISRKCRGLAVSQLEVSVIAFSICAIIIYALYWNSPKDVQVATTLHEYDGPVPKRVADIISTQHAHLGDVLLPFNLGETFGVSDEKKHVRQDFLLKFTNLISLLMLSSSIPFGAPHLIAWNFVFPTNVEAICWRVASIYCTFAGAVLSVAVLFLDYVSSAMLQSKWPLPKRALDSTLIFLFMFSYIVARLFLLVETFRTLLFLPPDAYIATWTNKLPVF